MIDPIFWHFDILNLIQAIIMLSTLSDLDRGHLSLFVRNLCFLDMISSLSNKTAHKGQLEFIGTLELEILRLVKWIFSCALIHNEDNVVLNYFNLKPFQLGPFKPLGPYETWTHETLEPIEPWNFLRMWLIWNIVWF